MVTSIVALIGVIARNCGNIFSVIMDWKILPQIAETLGLPEAGDVAAVRDILQFIRG